MKNEIRIRKIAFFVVMAIALLCLTAGAVADECAPGTHDLIEVITEKPTCNKTGKAITKCTVCGYVVASSERTVSMLPHDFTWVTDLAPQCQIKGREHQACKVCGSIGEYRDIDALDHDWAGWNVVKPATCTEKGEETRICKLNAAHKESREIAPLGHNWGAWTETTAPTCEKDGLSTRVCKNDASHTETKPIPATGHNWDEGKVTKQPDCTNPGVRTYTCKNDPAHTKTESIPIAPDAHKWDGGKITKAPNCTYPGERTYTCTINPAHTKTEAIPVAPEAHDWDKGTVIKAPTCDAPGTTQYTCRINPAHTKTETVPATGHNWDNGTVIKAPTFTDEGIKEYVCKNDPSHTRTEVLARLIMKNNTVCAYGPRLRDSDISPIIYPYTTDVWYMFTPFDASVEGVQTYDLIATNKYVVGTLTLTIRNGQLTVDYRLADSSNFYITLEFFTVLGSINDITKYEPEDLLDLNMQKGRPIDLAENFGDDTNLVLYFCSRCNYSYSTRYGAFVPNNYRTLRNAMLALMD